jgi:hypothetical protein
VRYRGESGRVAAVSTGDGGEFMSGYTDHRGCDAGILFCNDEGELTFFSEPTEDFELIHRADGPVLSDLSGPTGFPTDGRPRMNW